MQSASCVKGNVMSRNLTQPEEIDLILMTMERPDSGPDSGMDKPIPDGARTRVTMQDAGRNKSTMKPDSPAGEAHKKPGHGSPDPLPYVWSM
jgi:hypothetical protein